MLSIVPVGQVATAGHMYASLFAPFRKALRRYIQVSSRRGSESVLALLFGFALKVGVCRTSRSQSAKKSATDKACRLLTLGDHLEIILEPSWGYHSAILAVTTFLKRFFGSQEVLNLL